MTFKEADRKNVVTEFSSLNFQFTISDSLPLLDSSYILHHFLSAIKLHSHLPFLLCYSQIYYIFVCYITYSTVQYNTTQYILFHVIVLKSIKRRKEEQYGIVLPFRITYLIILLVLLVYLYGFKILFAVTCSHPK